MNLDRHNTIWMKHRCGAIGYMDSLSTDVPFEYRISKTAEVPIAIASATAALLKGFLDDLHRLTTREKQQWIEYLIQFQRDDGLFEDPVDLAHPTQKQPDWALIAHRSRHMAWAIETLGGKLKKPVLFLDPYLKTDAIKNWLDDLWQQDWPGGIWAKANWIMDMAVLLDLQYRHFNDQNAYQTLMTLLDILNEKQDQITGFWSIPGDDTRCAMAGSMHIYPIFWAYGKTVNAFERAVDTTLSLQQKDGYFAYSVGQGGSQCLDYDAAFILANGYTLFKNKRNLIRSACKRLLKAVLQNQNPDGSFADSRHDKTAYWATRAAAYRPTDGSVWDTYARLMTVAICISCISDKPPAPAITEHHFFEIFRAGQGWDKGQSPHHINTTKPTPPRRHADTTVIIPAYNVAPYIKRAIDSVLAQTCPPAEIIVVDDGSTDDTAQIVRTFGSKLRLLHQENAGVSAACNTGIKNARSEWLAFLDGDDLWMAEKLECQHDLLARENNLLWATCNFIYRCDQDDSQHPFLEFSKAELALDHKDSFDNFIRAAASGLGSPRSTMMIKRDVFVQVDPFQVGLTSGEDLDMWLRIAYRWPRIGFVNRPLAVYNWKRPDSLAERPLPDRLHIVCNMLDQQMKLASQHGKLRDLKHLVKKMLTHYVYQAYQNNGIKDLRKLLARYDNLFSPRLKTALRIMTTILPPGAPYAGKISRKLLGYKLPKRNG